MNARSRKQNIKVKSKMPLQKYVRILFGVLWLTLLLFLVLSEQAKTLQVNFANADLRSEIRQANARITEKKDRLRENTDLEAIAKEAEKLGLKPVTENQKRLLPQSEVNQMLVNRKEWNAILDDHAAKQSSMEQIYENLEMYCQSLHPKQEE